MIKGIQKRMSWDVLICLPATLMMKQRWTTVPVKLKRAPVARGPMQTITIPTLCLTTDRAQEAPYQRVLQISIKTAWSIQGTFSFSWEPLGRNASNDWQSVWMKMEWPFAMEVKTL